MTSPPEPQTPPVHPLHGRHERSFEANRFVYPVLSRRAGGLSVGINLNPDKICNFDCIYCQVDRVSPAERPALGSPTTFDHQHSPLGEGTYRTRIGSRWMRSSWMPFFFMTCLVNLIMLGGPAR